MLPADGRREGDRLWLRGIPWITRSITIPPAEPRATCSALIRNAGIEPQVDRVSEDATLARVLPQLIERMGCSVRVVLREKGTPYAELGLADPALTDEQLLDAMMAHPILINRPIVVTPSGVKLCRPSETVLDLLPAAAGEFRRRRRAHRRHGRASRNVKRIMSIFERYLTLWVALCIVAGIALGHLLPGVFRAIGAAEVAKVNIPVAVLIWLMIVPMLLQDRFRCAWPRSAATGAASA